MKRSILLVDDEEDIRDVLEIALQDMGYEVFTAQNGEEAIEVFRKEQPPVVVSDIKMPGMDGIELLRRIKNESPDTEFVMITGHGDMELAIVSFKDHAADFITKPIHVDVLEIALQKVFEKITSKRLHAEYTRNLERLIREKTELQNRLATLGLMISSIAHGIKGMLTGLDGGLYILESGLKRKDEKRIEDGWKAVTVSAERIRKQVLDILYYAKEREPDRKVVNVLRFAEGVYQSIEKRMQDQGISFVRNFSVTEETLSMDENAMHAALLNILDNAVDACMRDEKKAAHEIRFEIHPCPEGIRFDISDNGCGMDKDTRDKLFTLFFSSKGAKGTGLGLFITQQIVRQHGGTIHVTSTPGVGSSFEVIVPVSPGPDSPSADLPS
jgi:signal transduction histidine kinase